MDVKISAVAIKNDRIVNNRWFEYRDRRDPEQLKRAIFDFVQNERGDLFSTSTYTTANHVLAIVDVYVTEQEEFNLDAFAAMLNRHLGITVSRIPVEPRFSYNAGLLIVTPDHSPISSAELCDILREEGISAEIITKAEHETEIGAGDFYIQFLVGLAVGLSYDLLKHTYRKLIARYGQHEVGRLITTSFPIGIFVKNVSKELGKEEASIQLLTISKHKKGYEIALKIGKDLYHVRCDDKGNVLGYDEL